MDSSTFSIGQHPILNKENNTNNKIKQGRNILKQYLQEIGCTDTLIDVRSSRLRNLLGLKSLGTNQQGNSSGQSGETLDILTATNLLNTQHLLNQLNYPSDSVTNILNANQQLLQLSNIHNLPKDKKKIPTNVVNINGTYQGQLNGTSDVQKMLQLSETDAQSMLMMTNLDFMNTEGQTVNNVGANSNKGGKNLSDEDEEMAEEEFSGRSKIENGNKANEQQLSDAETEDALKEFSFLSNESSSNDESDWSVDKAQLLKMTEQYKKDRKSTKSAKQQHQQQIQQQQQQQNQQTLTSNNANSNQRPNRATLQAMIANLNEASESSQQQQTQLNKVEKNDSESPPSTNIPFTNPKIFPEEDESNLGELSRISVGNSSFNNSLNMSGISDETITEVR